MSQIRVIVEKINAPGDAERLDTHVGELPLSGERVKEIADLVADKLDKHSALADGGASGDQADGA